jgi:hypothetical protein
MRGWRLSPAAAVVTPFGGARLTYLPFECTAGRTPGPPAGNQHAVTHGRYAAATVAAKCEAKAREAKSAVKAAVQAADAAIVGFCCDQVDDTTPS